jgi:hypothetical protein
MAFSSYSFPSAESITRAFNAYGLAGDTVVRYAGATPTDLADAVWFNTAYVGSSGGGSTGGGGISIFSGSPS